MSMISNFLRVSTQQLEAYKKDSHLLEDRIYVDETDDDPHFMDIDKSWDGIIYLLTGKNFENASGKWLPIIFSGQLIDAEQDLGYGPAHYLTSAQVKDLSQQLSMITDEEVRQRFKPEEMMTLEVYPMIWDEGEDAFEYLMENFNDLKAFYAEAAQHDQAMISVIN